MPVTFAHPAAAVPFARWGLPMVALTMGSMAPDFPLFLGWPADEHIGHEWLGFFTFSIPAAIVATLVWQWALKYPVGALMPAAMRAKVIPAMRPYRIGGGRDAALLLAAVTLGAFTHVFWDSFTHAYGIPVNHWALLRTLVMPSPLGMLPVYKLLQYGGFPLGMGLLAFWAYRWLARASAHDGHLPFTLSDRGRRAILTIAPVVTLITGLGWAAISQARLDRFSPAGAAKSAIVSGTAMGALLLAAYCFYWHAHARARR